MYESTNRLLIREMCDHKAIDFDKGNAVLSFKSSILKQQRFPIFLEIFDQKELSERNIAFDNCK